MLSILLPLLLSAQFTDHHLVDIGNGLGGFSTTLDAADRFGRSIVNLGDLDGDGIGDIVIGARSDDDGGTDCGAVYICFLNQDGTVRNEVKISDGNGLPAGTLAAEDYFGYSLAALNDINNDGVQELIVGAPNDDDGGANAGAFYVLYLNPNGTLNSFSKSSNSNGLPVTIDAGDVFATALGAAGDWDGDGIEDLLVSATGDDDGISGAGAIYLMYMNANGSARDYKKVSSTVGGLTGPLARRDAFGGRSVTVLGDLNHDGVNDLAVGAFRDDTGGVDAGALYILFMNADFTVNHEYKISSASPGHVTPILAGDNFGHANSPLGDIDGDGNPDLATSANACDVGGVDSGALTLLLLNSDGSIKLEHRIDSSTNNFSGISIPPNDRFGRTTTMLGGQRDDGSFTLAVGHGAGQSGVVSLMSFNPLQLVISQLTHGATGDIASHGGTHTSPIYFAYSLAGNGPTQMPFGVVDLTQPINLISQLSSDTQGNTQQQIPVPVNAAGVQVFMQAVQFVNGSALMSNSVARVVQ
ncbi:MAG: FG-GAP repeat protein [Planctomycetes bacterium]|nr:FG-GAP repeat protein [Planctomycetota bacterium]